MNGILQRPVVVGLAMAVLLSAGSSGCESGRAGLVAPQWTLTDIEGTKHSLVDYEEQVVVLAFWSSDDLASRLAASDIQAVHEQFVNRGVTVFGISMQIVQETDAFFDVEHYTFTQLVSDGSATETYAVKQLPTFVVIGLGKGVVFREEGFTRGIGQRLTLAIHQQLRQHGM